MTEPTVTVLMSAYNAERHLAEAVDSVLAQTFRDFEFLIFDDGSTDSTLRILRGYSDPRIRLLENDENQGLTRNLERGMRMARGEFVARMDADDICMPQRLERQVEYLRAHPDIAVLGSSVTFFREGGVRSVGYQPLENSEIKCALLFGFTMLHPSVIMRKSEFAKHRLNYNPAFQVSQDHDLWVRAIRKMKFANLRDPLLDLRVHDAKIGMRLGPLQRELSDQVRKRQFEELGIEPTATELRLLRDHETLAAEWSKSDLGSFEAVLIKIIHANSIAQIFDQRILARMAAERFGGACRQMLIAHNGAGRRYWRSILRQYSRASVKQVIGMILRSAASVFPVHR